MRAPNSTNPCCHAVDSADRWIGTFYRTCPHWKHNPGEVVRATTLRCISKAQAKAKQLNHCHLRPSPGLHQIAPDCKAQIAPFSLYVQTDGPNVSRYKGTTNSHQRFTLP